MKKISYLLLLVAMVTLSAPKSAAQDVQLFYDLGHTLYGDLSGRHNVTSTVSMFKPDKWGSTFLFTDVYYYGDGAAGLYWEIEREFSVSKNKQWAIHTEYDGGLTTVEHTAIASRFQHALSLGLSWNWSSADFTKSFSVQAMYRQFFKGQTRDAFSSVVGTVVWSNTFANGLLTASGFCDVWYDPDVKGKVKMLAEPQFWVNLNTLKGMDGVNLSVGTEFEVSNNFVFNNVGRNDKFYVIPMVGAKWTF